MTDAEHIVEDAWWKSKKFFALAINHVVVLIVAIFGIVKQPNATGTIITGTVAEVGTVAAAHQASQAATDRAQAMSPYYPSGGAYPPPPQPPAGGAAPIVPPPTPPQAPTSPVH